MAVILKDVAKLAGTSSAAASAVLNGSPNKSTRVGQGTRERIYAAAAQLGYVSNPIARSLSTGKTGVIGLVLPYEEAFVDQNPFCTTLIAGVIHEAFGRGFNLMLYSATSGTTASQAAMRVDSRVDGVVVVMPEEGSAILLKCDRQQIPHVSVLRAPAPDTLSVNADDLAGGRIATEHLLRLGHRRIAHLAGTPGIPTTAPRMEGYRSAMQAAGLTPDDRLIIPAGFDRSDGVQGVKQLVEAFGTEHFPSAIFACNDFCAAGAMQALAEYGLKVPRDVAIVGFDDTRFCDATTPPLTSVRASIETMGVLAVRMLLSSISGEPILEPQPVIPVSLTVRQSCGASGVNDNSATSRKTLQ